MLRIFFSEVLVLKRISPTLKPMALPVEVGEVGAVRRGSKTALLNCCLRGGGGSEEREHYQGFVKRQF